MRIGVLGTGIVGMAIADRLVGLGHEVTMGSRSADNPDAAHWARSAGERAGHGTFADAAEAGELLFNCTAGTGSLDALRSAGAELVAGKILVDVANPLDFTGSMPPSLLVSNTDSLGEQIQRAFPEARVVKALNTMRCQIMVDPGRVPGAHDVFVCGDDAAAKRQVREMLTTFGWPDESIVDLGGIGSARGTEAYLLLWLRLWGALGSRDFNIHVAQAP